MLGASVRPSCGPCKIDQPFTTQQSAARFTRPCSRQSRSMYCQCEKVAPREQRSRRDVLQLVAGSGASIAAWQSDVRAAWGMDSRRLSQSELKDVIQQDFVQNQYYITGKLTPDVYSPDCQFKDPTTNVKGVGPYTTAVAKLFDPAKSKADLISLKAVDPQTLVLRWRLAATLNVPGSPAIKPYTGTTRYITNSSGLVSQHLEEWDISALDAFVSVLFPSFGAPPAPPIGELLAKS